MSELRDNLRSVCTLIQSRFQCQYLAMSEYAILFTAGSGIRFIIESPQSLENDEFNIAFSLSCAPSVVAEITKFLCAIPDTKFNIATDFYVDKDYKFSHSEEALESFIYDMINIMDQKTKDTKNQNTNHNQYKSYSYSGYPDIDASDYDFEGEQNVYGIESKEKRHNKKIH